MSLRKRAWIAVGPGLMALPAAALQFEVGDTEIKLDNLLTIGALMRMQERDDALIGKSSLNPGLCVRRTSGTPESGPDPDPNANTFAGDTCSGTVEDPQFGNRNNFYVAQPGSYAPNADNGDLNFDRHDIVHAAAKLTSDLSFELYDFNFFARSLWFFDSEYVDLDERHPDTTLQRPRTPYNDAAIEEIGSDIRFLDYFIMRPFELGGRQMSFKLGNQVLNWGESSFLALNSLNTINPPNQALLRMPGFDVKELFQPVGMAVLSAELASGVSLETFYQYDWEPVIVDPPGSYYSSSDTVGAGGTYAMLSFGKIPDDPDELYQPWRNPQDPAAVLGSRSDRTLLRNFDEEKRRRPDEGGQYGAALKLFFEDFNNGTEVGLYYANYHSRIPSVSAIAAEATCIPDQPVTGQVPAVGGALGGVLSQLPAQTALNAAGLLSACGVPPQNLLVAAGVPGATLAPATGANDPLPVGTAELVVEYPEDVHLFGVSFNTTVGDVAWSGEYAFRDNLPVQIHSTDLVFAALQPAFPAQDFSLEPVATLPGRRTAVPDFISVYRGIEIGPRDYIRGYERMKVGQLGTTFLKTIGGDNVLGASQIVALLELGMTHVLDFPDQHELQFQGAGVDTHISGGADGSRGINPRDVRQNPGDPNSPSTTDPDLRQNPTAQRRDGFGDEYSYGYRLVGLTRYDDALFGANLEFLTALFHDVKGVAPGLGQNFVEGRKVVLFGIRWDYLSQFIGEIRYTWNTGGGPRDALRDRDALLLYAGVQF